MRRIEKGLSRRNNAPTNEGVASQAKIVIIQGFEPAALLPSVEGSVTISVLKQILDRHKWRLRWKTLKRLDLKSIPMQHQLMVVLRRARFAIRLGPSHDKSLSFYEQ